MALVDMIPWGAKPPEPQHVTRRTLRMRVNRRGKPGGLTTKKANPPKGK